MDSLATQGTRAHYGLSRIFRFGHKKGQEMIYIVYIYFSEAILQCLVVDICVDWFVIIYMQYPMQFPRPLIPDLLLHFPQAFTSTMKVRYEFDLFSSNLPLALWIQIAWRIFSDSCCPQSDHVTLSIAVHWQWMHALIVHTEKISKNCPKSI